MYIYNIYIIYIYIYAQNRCLAVGWNCLKLGVLSWFLEISNGKMWRNTIWPHVSFFFLVFHDIQCSFATLRRLMEIVLLSLPSNLFYRQSLRSGLLSVLAADASLRRQAPEYFSGFFRSVSPKSVLSPQCLLDATKSVFSFLITSRCLT